MNISIPISVGELIDKLTILEIKSEIITDELKLKNINYERENLDRIFKSLNLDADIYDFYNELYDVNLKIWNLEDAIREHGKKLLYVDDYISFSQIAKQIYISNDLRSTIKKNINIKYNSEIIEEKNHND